MTKQERVAKLWLDAVRRMDDRYDRIIYRGPHTETKRRLAKWARDRWMQLFIEYQTAMGWLPPQ